jgi:alpha-tubulin suppressor-like RCC1 family protein
VCFLQLRAKWEQNKLDTKMERESVLALWGFSRTPSANSITTNDVLTQTRDNNRTKTGFCLFNLPPQISIKKIASTTSSACLLSECGSLFSWGNNCGHGANVPTTPLLLEIMSSHYVRGIAAGTAHYLCSTETGSVFSWGQGTHCLGHGMGVANLQFPTELESLHGEIVVDVAASVQNSFAITKNKCYTWGTIGSLLGVGSPDNVGSATPLPCPSLQGEMKSIHAGVSHVGILIDNRVYMWGSNSMGESCANSEQHPIAIPHELDGLGDGRTIQSLALGSTFTLALSSDGKVFGWGANNLGQLGIGVTKQSVSRVRISALASREVREVYAGGSIGACRTKDGQFFSWGANNTGQLGHGDNQNWTIPRRIAADCLLNDTGLKGKCLSFSHHSSLSAMSFESFSNAHELDAREQLLQDIAMQFNEEVVSDLTILVEDRKIFVSKVH